MLAENRSNYWTPTPAFHPSLPVLATFDDKDESVRIWELDVDVLLGRAPRSAPTAYMSAKVVLLGDSNVGKSWLATQLVERRTPTAAETGTTYGMKIWKAPAAEFHPPAAPPADEQREVFLWDFGGQDEYQLVHQMFLHDTALALILIDPTRSGAEREKAKAWNLRLAKQIGIRTVTRILVGSKVDDDTRAELIDRAAIDRVCSDCTFAAFHPTSATTGRGVGELREAIARALDWSLGRTTRPELFQRIREDLDERRAAGQVVVTLRDFNADLRARYPAIYDERAAAAVTDQLAGQGLLAKTRTRDGDEALILRVEVVEQYGASLVVLARDNPRGVPAVPESDLGARRRGLPGIRQEGRLKWVQERVVLECVAELMIRHGVCFRHQGVLVFPTLFPEPATETEAEKLPHAVSLWYDFTGAIDNVYASLVAGLMVVQPFGSGRLTARWAEFEHPKLGLCGLRRLRRPGGLAHLELFFGALTPEPHRDEFVAYVEAHLRDHGVEVTEYRAVKCPGCGKTFSEETVRARVNRGKNDLNCEVCDRRTLIEDSMVGGVAGVRERDPQTDSKVFALRQKIQERLDREVAAAKAVIAAVDGELPDARSIHVPGDDRFALTGSAAGRGARDTVDPTAAEQIVAEAKPFARAVVAAAAGETAVRVLHLSDLHFTPDTKWRTHLDPLLHDLRRKELGCEVVQHLVVSGDFVDRGNARAFPAAREFVSALRGELGLTIEQVVLVPGNHDVVDDDAFYQWRSKKDGLKEGEYLTLERGFLGRDAVAGAV